jgi:hypothetical protein
MTVNDELRRLYKDVVMAYIKVLLQHSLENVQNHKTAKSG